MLFRFGMSELSSAAAAADLIAEASQAICCLACVPTCAQRQLLVARICFYCIYIYLSTSPHSTEHAIPSLISSCLSQQLQGDCTLALLPKSSHMFGEPAVHRATTPLRKKLLIAVQGGSSR